MSNLRTAAQQALEFIRWSQFVPCQSGDFPEPPSTAPQVEAALKAALAEPVQEPVQEPVAWSHINGTSDTKWHSPQRKPATIDEMFDRMDKAPRGVFFGHDPMTIWMEAWRAAEQHHGIREGA
jgi:hypothetical protein